MRRRELCYTIRDREDGIVLGQFLKAKGFSHRLTVRIKAAQGLAVDGIAVYAGYRLKTGQTVEVTLPEEEDSGNIVPVKLPLSIVYEDEDILVINKDAGVPIHPSQGHYRNKWPGAESGGSTGPLYLDIHLRKARLTAPLPGQRAPPSSAGWTMKQAKGQSPISVLCATMKKRTCLW